MLRRKKKNGSAPPDEAGTAAVEDAPAVAQSGSTDPVTAEVPAPAAARGAAGAEPGDAAIAFAEGPPPVEQDPAPDEPDRYDPGSAEAVQRRRRYAPSDAPLTTPSGGEERLPVSYWVGSVQSVVTKSATSSAEEREREAAAEFQAAIMPGLMGLRDAVPDAASPDDALRVLAEREAEHDYPDDPEAGSLSQRDIFRSDASVYYRIRNRFEKPRRRVGWGDPWRPPPGLARPDPPRRALDRGE